MGKQQSQICPVPLDGLCGGGMHVLADTKYVWQIDKGGNPEKGLDALPLSRE